MSTAIFSEGGVDAERLRTVAAGEFADNEIAGYQEALRQGIRLTGANSFDRVVLQQFDAKAVNGVGVVVVYLCSDLSQTDVVDSNGSSVVDVARPDHTPFEVSFDWAAKQKALIVGDRKIWMGGGVC